MSCQSSVDAIMSGAQHTLVQPPFSTRRRFIAGAVCPRCAGMDKISVDLDSDMRVSVACGFSDARPDGATPQEPSTRVTRAAARRTQTEAQVVTLVDPGIQDDVSAADNGGRPPAPTDSKTPEDPAK